MRSFGDTTGAGVIRVAESIVADHAQKRLVVAEESQGDGTNTFHVFDRVSLQHVGAFTGAKTRRTDGVALTQRAFGPFQAGAFFGSHLDGGVGAISWFDIASALKLRADCRTYIRPTSPPEKRTASRSSPFFLFLLTPDYSPAPPLTPGRGSAGNSSSSAIEKTFGSDSAMAGSGSKPSGCASSMSTS